MPNPKGGIRPRNVQGAAFLQTIYSLFGWEPDYQYRFQGLRRRKDTETVILFNMKEPEVHIPRDELHNKEARPVALGRHTSVTAYPSTWADTFGSNYYWHSQARELSVIDKNEAWRISEEAQPFTNSELKVTPPDQLIQGIRQIIEEKKQGGKADGADHTEERI